MERMFRIGKERSNKGMKRYIGIVSGRIAADVQEYGMAFSALLIYMVVVNLVFHAFCPLVIFSGFPCPGCGITRAAVCFLTGKWRLAWDMNPVIFPVMLTVFYFGINRYLLGQKAKGIKWLIVLVLALLVITYGVRMYLYFPDWAPYVYTQDNMLERFFPFYKRFLHKTGIL